MAGSKVSCQLPEQSAIRAERPYRAAATSTSTTTTATASSAPRLRCFALLMALFAGHPRAAGQWLFGWPHTTSTADEQPLLIFSSPAAAAFRAVSSGTGESCGASNDAGENQQLVCTGTHFCWLLRPGKFYADGRGDRELPDLTRAASASGEQAAKEAERIEPYISLRSLNSPVVVVVVVVALSVATTTTTIRGRGERR